MFGDVSILTAQHTHALSVKLLEYRKLPLPSMDTSKSNARERKVDDQNCDKTLFELTV